MRTDHLTVFDFWLRSQLSREAGTAMDEPLPDDWVRLLPPDGDPEAA